MNKNILIPFLISLIISLIIGSMCLYKTTVIYEKLNEQYLLQFEESKLKFDSIQIKMDSIIAENATFELYLEALSYVESRHNDNAIGTSNDVGRYQITPIYVDYLNQRLKQERYHYDDRKDPKIAKSMVYRMNKLRNPSLDIEVAIKIHNPKAPPSYRKQILDYMEGNV